MSKEVLISKDANLLTNKTNELATETEKPTEKVENPKLGIAYFCLAGFIFCVNFMFGKVLYEHHPGLGATQLLVYRSTVSVIMLSAYLNKQIKFVMYDSVDAASIPPLATRVITGNFAIFVNFMAVKYFKLTMVAMAINCAPLMTLILAGPILKEKITVGQVASLVFAFGGIVLMILGGEERETRAAYTPHFMAYVALIMNPLCISAGNLAMRAMRKLHDNVVSAYMALSLFVVFLPICLLSGDNLTLWFNFSIVDWICLIGISAGTILAQTLRFMALQNHTVSGLQPYTFLQPLQQFLTDVLLFDQSFSIMQMVGMNLLILVYIAQLFIACYENLLEIEKRNEELDKLDREEREKEEKEGYYM